MDLSQQRKSHLEEQLRRDLELLKEYEDVLHLSDDPKQRARYRREIEALQKSIDALRQELQLLLSSRERPEWLAAEVQDYLGLLGYRVIEEQAIGDTAYDLVLTSPTGLPVQTVLVRSVVGDVTIEMISSLREMLGKRGAMQAWLITQEAIPQAVRQATVEESSIQLLHLDDLIRQLVSFEGYFSWLRQAYERHGIALYYVDLAATKLEYDTQGKVVGQERYDPVDRYIDAWLQEPSGSHILILGDFGSGKTWLCYHLAYTQLKRYLANPTVERLPILIPLREFARSHDVEQLVLGFLRQHSAQLVDHQVFEKMNRQGRFLIILDGLDQMSLRTDYDTVIKNFKELTKLAVSNSKMILTSRTAYFRHALETQRLLSEEQTRSATDLRRAPNFEVLQLEALDEARRKEALSKRVGSELMSSYWERISETYDLYDLLQRPVLLEMMARVLPQLEGERRTIDTASLYRVFTDRWLNINIAEQRTFVDKWDKLLFMIELAWKMIGDPESQHLRLHYTEIRDLVQPYFKPHTPQEIDYFAYDLRTQSFLVRDSTGNYQFAHRSLAEYFVALKLAFELGVASPEYLEGIPAEKRPEPLVFDRLADTFGKAPLVDGVREFLRDMIGDHTRIIELLAWTRDKEPTRIGFMAHNARTLLLGHLTERVVGMVEIEVEALPRIIQKLELLERFTSLCDELSTGVQRGENVDFTDFANMLTTVLDLDQLSEYHEQNGFGIMLLDSASTVRGTRLPSELPLVFYIGSSFASREADKLRRLIVTSFGLTCRVVGLITFLRGYELDRFNSIWKQKLGEAYAYDIVHLGKDDLYRVAFAANPVDALRSVLLGQVSLSTISPFVAHGPTPDNMFFGREKELREIAEHAATANYALIGGRRIGKTSVLRRLESAYLPAVGFRTLYHDCSFTPTQAELVQAVVADKAWFAEPPESPPESFATIVQSLPDDKPPVILLDEADKLIAPDRAAGYALFNTLRAMANADRCRFVLSGEQALRSELSNSNSPLYNFAKEMLIGRLDFRAVEELVTRPMKQLEIVLGDEAETVQRIWDFTSGHPNVAQLLCQRLIVRLNQGGDRRLTLDDVEAVVADPDFLRKDFLNIYWERATALERLCSLVMAADDNVRTLAAVHETLARHDIRTTLNEADDALERLVDLRNILQRTAEGYEFAVTAFPEVIAKTARLEDLIALNRETYQHYGDVEPRSKRGSP